MPQAAAWNAWDLPISPPSSATAEFKDMFCALNGATRRPVRANQRQSAVVITLLPAWDAVPWTINV
jgi:hypothetical protein